MSMWRADDERKVALLRAPVKAQKDTEVQE